MNRDIIIAVIVVVLIVAFFAYRYYSSKPATTGATPPPTPPPTVTEPSTLTIATNALEWRLPAEYLAPNTSPSTTTVVNTAFPFNDQFLSFAWASTGLYKSKATTAGPFTDEYKNLWNVVSSVFYCIVLVNKAGVPFFFITSDTGTSGASTLYYPGNNVTYPSGQVPACVYYGNTQSNGFTNSQYPTTSSGGWLGCGAIAPDANYNKVQYVSFSGGKTGTLADFISFPGPIDMTKITAF